MTGNIQISRKLRDDSIIVIGGNTWDEFSTNVREALGQDGLDGVASQFYHLIPGDAGSAGIAPQRAHGSTDFDGPRADVARAQSAWDAGVQALNQGFPQAQPAAQPNAAPICAHGTMRLVPAGISKATNKPYKAFYGCAASQDTPRDQKCKSIYPN